VNITVKLFATFRNGRFKSEQQDWAEGTQCREIFASLGLTGSEIGIVLINGRHATLEQVLEDGDTLSLFPLVGGG
jgi:molybdopterin synthase sulfur carrier subunit